MNISRATVLKLVAQRKNLLETAQRKYTGTTSNREKVLIVERLVSETIVLL